jgi:putative intracellular protease/amidase
MTKYLVTVEARLSYAVVSEVYEIEAPNVDDAETLVLIGGGTLLEERVEEGETIDEFVTQVCTFTAGNWVCS